MDSLANALILISLIVHAFLFAYVQARRDRVRTGRRWLLLTLCLTPLASAALLFPPDLAPFGHYGGGALALITQAAVLTVYGALVMHDVTNRSPRLWLVFGTGWLALLLIASVTVDTVRANDQSWLIGAFTTPNLFHMTMLAGLALAGIVLLGTIFYAFYVAPLPEIANRALFWVMNVAFILTGIILLGTGTNAFGLPGILILMLGTLGTTYAQVTHRIFDIRGEMATALRNLVMLGLTALVIFAALIVANALHAPHTAPLFGLIALVAAALYLPIRQFAELMIGFLVSSSTTHMPEATRRYTRTVSSAVELNSLVDAATRSLNNLLRARCSGLILVNEGGGGDSVIELHMLPADGRPVRGYLLKNGVLYRHFAVEGSYLSQFDIEFDPAFREVSEGERLFFRDTGMSAYAPIIAENALIGLLAVGAKINDAPFTVREFELLATLASQTGTALRSARLVADLRTLNQETRALNRSLEDAKEQMEKLDAVKTDFVTIASHELRTPLAQIRGYTDIVDALNEQGLLDQDQTSGMVANIRKATERMEELIAAMLDVSQIDVNAMDLHFTQTSLESVIRMAIEPLTDAIKQRKLTLAARGLRNSPIIQADMNRLVQAFRNVVLNAIKFTPDGGRIDITAQIQPAERAGGRDHVLVTIRDTGVGIDKDDLELVFRKFYRAFDPGLHSTGSYKFMGAGPGLGLTIAQGVIEGHGGKIWAESAGHNMQTLPGTSFYILLPVTPPEEARRVLPFQSPNGVMTELTPM